MNVISKFTDRIDIILRGEASSDRESFFFSFQENCTANEMISTSNFEHDLE